MSPKAAPDYPGIREAAREIDTREREASDAGDHDKFAHYADKNKIAEAYVTGIPIVALCGKKWVPTRAPEKFPVCPDCAARYEALS
jgi:hypothetical protein